MNARKSGGKRLQELRRKRPTRTPSPLVLIVCEGAETEPNYFDVFRQRLRLSKSQLKICGKECGSHPKSVVKHAKEEKNEIGKDGLKYDHIWCVFDCDQHENIHEALNQAEGNKFKVAFSNPCFELWYLYHFQDQTAHIERDAVIQLLKHSYIPDYEKSMGNIYNLLLERQAVALERAKQVRKWHKDNGDEETENPSTTVDTLVEELESIFSRFQKGR